MRADNTTTEHNRFIKITGIEDPNNEGYCPELEIMICYRVDGNANKGMTIDNVIIPAIIKAINGQ